LRLFLKVGDFMRLKLTKLKLTDDHIREACLLVGFCSLIYGIWLIYQPAAWIVGGLILIWLGMPPRPPKGGQ
jgi:hypothetical protein